MYDEIRAFDAMIARLRERFPSLIDLSTGRIERLLTQFNRPQDRLPPVIHVAGTNGKGSTTAYLRAIAEAAGLKAHVLTSPHLVRFAERIRVAGELITEAELTALIDRMIAVNADQPISFNEMLTAMAIVAFADKPADLSIIEVGLGGRFDSTNVFEAPAVSVITPVDYDHLEMLGPELSKIAWEKAGIIKRGRPVVVARQLEEALEVIAREADELEAPMLLMGRDFDAWEERGRLMVQTPDQLLDLPAPSLFGGYQFANAGAAVMAAIAWGHPAIDEAALAKGVASAVWPARFQRLTAGPLAKLAAAGGADLWLDGGHNPHAGRALAEAAGRLTARDGRGLALVTAMYARKDALGFFQPFGELKPTVFTTGFDSANAASPEDLAAAARGAGLEAQIVGSVEEGVTRALKSAEPPPHILICGGLHFAGEVLAMSPETWPS
ncbi:folylpolyglutamate synthase/dihydrofolate synthase family protein [Phenylobacterium sp.]|uniref:bifunctional folylpolyglutamate synthase/dihydrofolate synthase n=1 Tax=Phenylobacterium sp. TaxID=1871053 RepID=UPI0027280802|nr:folylpolyglutamate synthase/dihydrofolate synthase family protein [Phenylobacterium sp.]MDO8377739.1 folylpolyglutamate synthase/dihydrofolate synthase family protein [Phenylobacterium sp.]